MPTVTDVEPKPTHVRGPVVLGRLRRLPWGRIVMVTAVTIAVVGAVPPLRRAAAIGTSRAMLFVLSPLAPDLKGFDELARGSRVVAADGTVLADLDGAQLQQPVKLTSLPEHVPHAVLAAEDAKFYGHGGVDPAAVFRALVRNVQGDRQGASTITQQLAKLNYAGSSRTLFRKFREVQYAVRLEKKYSKDELLERYLNQVYFGDGAYGIAAASQVFFATTPDRLSPAQAATLAGKIRAPAALDPRRVPEKVVARRDAVLRAMHSHGWLSDEDLQAALTTPLQVAPATATAGVAPHFVGYVEREAEGLAELGPTAEARRKALFTGGYKVTTTLDTAAQQAAAGAVGKALPDPADPDAAVVSVVPGDGAIRVLVGGRDFASRKFDLATQGRRQPGSSFKPYVYLSAVHQGIDPRSTFDSSSPMQLEYQGHQYSVDNYEGEGGGRLDLDTAMAHSVNTVFAQLILKVGPDEVKQTAQRLGVADVDANVGDQPAIALGGLRRGVTPLEQAAAFATFAAKGVYARPYAIARITDRHGRTVFQRRPDTEPVFDAGEVGVLTGALARVVTEGTGTAARIDRPAAGKTGTTQDHGDAWFVGFVPQLATAVWMGYPDRLTPMTDVHGRRVTGGSFPAQIWASTMRVAVAALPRLPLPVASPDSLNLHRLDPPPSTAVPPPPTVVPLTLAPVPPPTDAVVSLPTTSTLVTTTTTTTLPGKQTSTTTSSTTSTTSSTTTTTTSTTTPSTTTTTRAKGP